MGCRGQAFLNDLQLNTGDAKVGEEKVGDNYTIWDLEKRRVGIKITS